MRTRFVDEFLSTCESPGLVAIYVSKRAPKANASMRGKLTGVMEMSKRIGSSFDFIDVDREPIVRPELEAGKWLYSVQATRAWRVSATAWPTIDDLADRSYSAKRARYIGAQGVELERSEVQKLLRLPVERANVYAP
jgi:hypothetical protein